MSNQEGIYGFHKVCLVGITITGANMSSPDGPPDENEDQPPCMTQMTQHSTSSAESSTSSTMHFTLDSQILNSPEDTPKDIPRERRPLTAAERHDKYQRLGIQVSSPEYDASKMDSEEDSEEEEEDKEWGDGLPTQMEREEEEEEDNQKETAEEK